MAMTVGHARNRQRLDRSRRPSIGTVRLTVSDLDSLARLLRARDRPAGRPSSTTARSRSAPPASEPLIELHGDSSAPRSEPPRDRALSPGDPASRRAATWRSRWRGWPRRGWPLDGASDHLVSEALYLSDPGRQRDRDLPRPSARASGRVPDDQLADGDDAARPRRRDRRAPPRRPSSELMSPLGRGSATSTFRSRTWTRPRPSTTACSAST